MNTLFTVLFVSLLATHSLHSCQSYNSSPDDPLKKAIVVHKVALDQRKAAEIKKIEYNFAQKQERFVEKVRKLEDIIFDASILPPEKLNWDCVYFRQEPIIFYLAKKDLLNHLLVNMLDMGANPLQKHPFYSDPAHAATPLSTAQDAHATKNIQTLQDFIVRAQGKAASVVSSTSSAPAVQQRPTYASVAQGCVERIKRQQEIEKQQKVAQELLQRLERLQINCYDMSNIKAAIAENNKEGLDWGAYVVASNDAYHEVLKILLDAGADPNYTLGDFGSTFGEACFANGNISKNARLLLARGAKPHLVSVGGRMVSLTKPPVIEWLIQHGAKEEEIWVKGYVRYGLP